MVKVVDVDEGDGAASSEIALLVVGLDDQRVRALEARHIEEMKGRYGGRGPGPLVSEEFEPPDGCFVVAVLNGAAVACGGFHLLNTEIAEIKRMFVEPRTRGGGVGRRILSFLEERARATGCTETWLETGSEQPDAVALYTSAGYRPRCPTVSSRKTSGAAVSSACWEKTPRHTRRAEGARVTSPSSSVRVALATSRTA